MVFEHAGPWASHTAEVVAEMDDDQRSTSGSSLVEVRPADTSPEARRLQQAIWRRMGSSERVRLAAEMSEEARQVALAGIARRRPELSQVERIRELVRLMHGIDLPATPEH